MADQPNTDQTRRVQDYSYVPSIIAILVGCLVLVGWVFDNEPLKRVIPGLVAMNPTTAVAFIMAGGSLSLLPRGSDHRRHRLAQLLALGVTSIGLLKLATIFFGLDLGVDQLLFASNLEEQGDLLPNRMAPNTALSFFLAGSALLLLSLPGRRACLAAQVSALIVALVSLLAILGYAYGASSFYSVAAFIPMALHTALTFFVLALGILFARPREGLMAVVTGDTVGGVTARRLLLAAVALPAILGWLRLQGERMGLYETAAGVALLAMANIVTFMLIVWWNAGLLHRADSERRRAELALQQANADLERRVEARTGEIRAATEQLQSELAERRRAEEEIRRLNTRLEQRVRERTVQFEAANEELQRAIAEVESANRAKSEFLSRMSHELRTPLNAILGFGQLLQLDELPAQHQESVEQIIKGGRHLLELINEVLDIARIESGRLLLSPEPVEVGETLREVVELVRPLAAQRSVRIHFGDDQLCDQHVQADRQRFKQVFLNLLANAVKYNRDGGEVTLTCVEVGGGQLRIQVRDTGMGIPADKLEQLFIPFQRLGAEQTSVEGTGLGLALSQRLVTAMGGHLGVESTAGQGSIFWVELLRVDSPTQRLAAMDEEETSPMPVLHGRKVVLYVEDNLSNLRLIEHLLARRPEIGLISTMQGALALDLARQHAPDLIFLDLHLPDLPGDEILHRLLSDSRTRDIPVVILSADATPRRGERLLAAGAHEYLTKPLDVKRFFEVVDATLRDSGG